ncbi:MAG: lipoyl synthase [Endomicrobium sp.]|jgi:lipoic acid synthetase|nr:lipoyl synthase [Endomicrobium sp.]
MSQNKKKINISEVSTFRKKYGLEKLNTVCQNAMCPNINECFKRKTVTFLILGNVCTRKCTFCGIQKYGYKYIDKTEPLRIARAIKKLGFLYNVITSVTRDDLKDGGANHFAETVSKIRAIFSSAKIEVLVPDFLGNKESIDIVLNSKPDVFAHNLETVCDLYDDIRKGAANYKRSLLILKYAKSLGFRIKTGIMLGLGENKYQILKTINDIKNINVDILTIGQYLAPTNNHHPVVKEYTYKEFEAIKYFAVSVGINHVISGRYIRSSYLSEQYFK